jgi:hypothetical protein
MSGVDPIAVKAAEAQHSTFADIAPARFRAARLSFLIDTVGHSYG